MRILADASPIYNGQLTGVGYFTDELLKHIALTNKLEGYVFNFRKKKKISRPYPILEQQLLPGKILTYPRYAKVDLPLRLFFNTSGYDAILGTNYLIPPAGKTPTFPIVHDLCLADHPEWVQGRNGHILRLMLPKTLERSTGLITISEFSATRIREVYNYRKPILVIGIPPKNQPNKNTAAVGSLDKKKFFLFVGTIEPRKNLSTLLNAYESLSTKMQNSHKLVLAGKPGWDSDVLNRLRSTRNKNIIYLDYVSEEQRTWLYRNCTATIIPSHYEGFGMMSLESLDMGSPTILSDIPPHREILGNKGAYFQVDNVKQLSNLMEKFSDVDFKEKMYATQRTVLANYSWDSVANSVVDFIRLQISQ